MVAAWCSDQPVRRRCRKPHLHAAQLYLSRASDPAIQRQMEDQGCLYLAWVPYWEEWWFVGEKALVALGALAAVVRLEHQPGELAAGLFWRMQKLPARLAVSKTPARLVVLKTPAEAAGAVLPQPPGACERGAL